MRPTSEKKHQTADTLKRGGPSIKGRLAFGFGVLVVMLTLSGAVSLWQIDRIDSALLRIVNVEEPLEEALLEMEIHAGETARAILQHMHEPTAEYRQHAVNSEHAFQKYAQQFETLVENEEEQRLGKKVFGTYTEFKALGDEIITVSLSRRTSLQSLRSIVSNLDEVLDSISRGLAGDQQSREQIKLTAALRMEVEIEKAFAAVEAYTAMHDPELKEELDLAIDRFRHEAKKYREAGLSGEEIGTVAQLEKQFATSVKAAHEAIALADQLDVLSKRFEGDLVEMDTVLDDEVQPIIQAETVLAAEDAMDSSRRAISLLACLSVMGVLVGGFLGWHISRGIIEPVNELVRGTKIIGEGNRDHRIQIGSTDELGHLANAFNGMVDSLNQSADELLKSQQEAEQLKLEAAQREIEQHATAARTDQLTQLHNRRSFDDLMVHYAEECTATGQPLTMILYDVDRFKKFNDDYGHQAGDEVLQGVARVLEGVFQAPLYAARFGGEEFAAILPHHTLSEAAAKAEEARIAIEESAFDIGGKKLQVTASGGLAALQPEGDIDTIIRQADDALYKSKDAGRNCIHLHDGEEITSAVEHIQQGNSNSVCLADEV